MIWPRRRHPRYDVLSRLADRELTAEEAMRVNAHLAECAECREEVDFMVALSERLRDLYSPAMPNDVLPEILDMRAARDPVMPEADSIPRRRSRRMPRAALTAAAGMLAAVVGFALFGARDVEAGASSFDLAVVDGGSRARVTYSTVGQLAAEPVLWVRGEYITDVGHDWEYELPVVVEAELTRSPDGEFEGELRLPARAVYARFAVERPDGSVVDHGLGPWESLETGADGQPTFRALMAKSRFDVERLDYFAAVATVERLTEMYRDRPEAWSRRLYVEQQTVKTIADRSRAQHERRFRDFVDRLPSYASADYVATLAWYAIRLGDDDAMDHLVRRLETVAPGHPVASQVRVGGLLVRHYSEPLGLVAGLEDEWSAFGTLPQNTFATVVERLAELDQTDAAVRWFDRWVAAAPDQRASAAELLGALRTPSRDVVNRLRGAVGWVEGENSIRGVGVSTGRYESDRHRTIRNLLRALGGHQIWAGEVDAGYRSLARAAESAWDGELLERVAELAVEHGTVDDGVRYRSLAAADPIGTPAFVTRQRLALRDLGVRASDFEARRSFYAGEIASRLFEANEPLYPRGPILVETTDGVSVDLLDELGATATIVQFWSPYLRPTIDAVASLAEHCSGLAESGIRILWVSEHLPFDGAPDVVELPEACDALRVDDVTRSARVSLRRGSWGQVIVFDGSGATRFRGTTDRVEDARRAALLVAGQR